MASYKNELLEIIPERTLGSFDKTRITRKTDAIWEAAVDDGNSTGSARSETSLMRTASPPSEMKALQWSAELS